MGCGPLMGKAQAGYILDLGLKMQAKAGADMWA